MTYQCKIKFTSHVDHGDIIIGKVAKSLLRKTYEHEFTASETKGRIFSLKNLSTGLDKGVELISFEIDGFTLPDPKEFTCFKMEGNPYVDNTILNEKEFLFNGELQFEIDEDRLNWFPYYYSEKKIDFVYHNNLATCLSEEGCWFGEKSDHTGEFLNVPWHPSVKPEVNDKFALGCSITYGTAIDRRQAWPQLVGYKNFGMPGAGVDSIFYNCHRLIELFKPESFVILFPDLSRRLLEFEKRGNFFRIPIISTTNKDSVLPATPNGETYWIDKKEINILFEKKKEEMILDENNDYSKYYLGQIADLAGEIHVSSWSRETYEILPKYFKTVLPFFERLDLAKDEAHPGPKSHKNWATQLKNHNI